MDEAQAAQADLLPERRRRDSTSVARRRRLLAALAAGVILVAALAVAFAGGVVNQGHSGVQTPAVVTAWAPAGTLPLTDAQAAALVVPEPETVAANAQANSYVPTSAELAAFYAAKNTAGQSTVAVNPLNRYVTGRPGIADPSTDDLIQWVSAKWGIPTDIIRAEMVLESRWQQSALSDRRTVSAAWYKEYPASARVAGSQDVLQSAGIAQVKWAPDGSVGAGTEPLRSESTAFNLDYYAATVRFYYDGDCDWCSSGYSSGQAWNSVGAWYSPAPWANSAAQNYIHEVQDGLAARTWTDAGF
jgi:hypothetical protein